MKLLRSPFAGALSLLVGCQFAIVAAAPGNGWRLAAYPGSRDLAVGLPWSLVDAATFLLLRVAALPTPFCALSVQRYEPPVPVAGVPASTPVVPFSVTPDGGVQPVMLNVRAG